MASLLPAGGQALGPVPTRFRPRNDLTTESSAGLFEGRKAVLLAMILRVEELCAFEPFKATVARFLL